MDINLKQVDLLCKKYGFKYKYIPRTLIVQSQLGTWYIYQVDKEGKKYQMKHKNRYYNKNREHWHKKKFYDIPFILYSIKNHDKYKINRYFQKYQRIDKLLQENKRTYSS